MKKEENFEMKEAHPTKQRNCQQHTNTQSYITLADP